MCRRAGEQGKVDVALVDRDTLTYLIGQGLVEPIDRTLVPNLRLVSAPLGISTTRAGLRS